MNDIDLLEKLSNAASVYPLIEPNPQDLFYKAVSKIIELRAQVAELIPEGYVLMPTELTAENGAKGLLLGDFSVKDWIECGQCENGIDFDGIDCDACDGQGGYHHQFAIDWPVIKDIYKKAVSGLSQPPANKDV